MKHKLWSGPELKSFQGDTRQINAHESAFEDSLEDFHTHENSISLLEKNHNELSIFFQPLQKISLGVHQLCSYNFLRMDFEKYFSNFAIVLVKPNPHRLHVYSERFEKATEPDYHTQWWAKNLSKKSFDKVPKWFLEQMSIKEKQKYIESHILLLNHFVDIDPKNTIVFDPDNIVDPNLLQHLINKVCSTLYIDNFKLPFDKIQMFIKKNSKFLT
jgi:predicted HD phosphohydrolase